MEPLVVILLVVLVFALVLHRIASRRERRVTVTQNQTTASSDFSRLVAACLGDTAKARRLVEFEQRRASFLGFHAAAARALERLQQDRGR